jgi:glycerol-3-phosphate acyltransferase PlsY
MPTLLVFLALTYLLAAVPFGVVVTTLWGGDVDIRSAGSGNIGATNVARVYGWRVAVAVLALDALKGLLPVLLAWAAFGDGPVLGIVAVVAFVGHCWPVYLEFRGGKGVATAAGAMLGLAPLPTLLAGATWGLLLAITGKSSVAALGATLGMLGFVVFFAPEAAWVGALLAIGIVVRHLTNIGRIVRGEEAEIVRPVRWSRRGESATAEDALHQDPGGGAAASPLWKERADPLVDPEG